MGLAAVVALLVALLVPFELSQAATPCDPPITNPITCENSKPGNPPSEWDVSGAGSSAIQGFATDISIDQGGTVGFKVDTTATRFRIDIYRLGFYGGQGARRVATIADTATTATIQQDCRYEDSTGLEDCGNWSQSASWTAPPDAVSGLYIAKLVATQGLTGASHVPFIVRDDDGQSPILFQTSDTTWQAYNSYGGNSLYSGRPDGRAYKVSYNRPFVTRGGSSEDWIFNAEYPSIRFLEANGYNVSYTTGVDSDRRGALIRQHQLFLSVGHDEYWSGPQRANVEAARDAGVHLAFMSGNEVFWKTRWESSIDGSGTPHRTLVTYKETHADAKIDPIGSATWTGTWRDPRFSPPGDGGRPENALTGQLFTVNCCTTDMTVGSAFRDLRFWRNTRVASLAAGQQTTLGSGILGYEWDEDLDNGHRPAGLIRMSETADGGEILQDYGSRYADGDATHHLTLYRAPSGALVFGAGTVQWGWGLDDNHDDGEDTADVAVQQATVNLLADMGVQPSTLQSGLVAATISTDVTPPTSTIAAPAAGATLPVGQAATISGTASDSGGVVGGVEVSTDNGQTWHPAAGRTSWTYSWTPATTGSFTIRTRATDDSGRRETPATGRIVTVGSGGGGGGGGGGTTSCPCTIWPATSTPATAVDGDSRAVELGVKFRASESGRITGISFYKGGAANGGTHLGRLWTSTGTKLAEATFVNESATGWQQVNFAQPVQVAAGTTYVASYYAPLGRYSVNNNYFTTATTRGPLTALATGTDGPNALYRYGSGGGFPTSSYQGSNYWVDVVFEPDVDTTKPSVTSRSPEAGATNVSVGAAVSAGFSEPVTPQSVSYAVSTAGGAVAGSVSYDATTRTARFTPTTSLTAGTNYSVTLSGAQDASGNVMLPDSWTFTTIAPDTVKPTLTGQLPAAGAVDVARTAAVGATFSEPVQSATVSVSLSGPSGSVAGTTSYNADARTVTFVPISQLAASTAYTATVSGAADTSGNVMDPVSWSFTTVAGDTIKPTVTDRSPAPGATSVAVGTTVTATFSEAVQQPTIAISVVPTGGSAVAGTTSYDTATRRTTFAPSTALAGQTQYTVTVSGARDTEGNTMDPVTWSFTTGSASECPCTIWAPTATPTTPAQNDNKSVEIGVKFRSNQAGLITGIRFYKAATNTGTHVGSLWSATGTRLATVTFSGESASGWQQASFSAPVAVTANTTYVASYYAPSGRYSINANYFTTATTRGPLTALTNGTDGPNGVYRYGAGGGFPTSTYQSSNYWVDVVFAPTADTTKPSVITRTPAPGGTGVGLGTTISASFDEPVQPATVTMSVSGPGGGVTGASQYDAANRTVTFTPAAALTASTQYTASVSGAKDLAGNTMDPITWSFTTQDVDATKPSITDAAPVAGATGVPLGATVAATFSEAVQQSTITLAVTPAGGAAVAGSLTYDETARTARFTPTGGLAATTSYTVLVTGARDAAGNVIDPVTWSFTTGAASFCPCTIFPTTATPATPAAADSSSIEVGVKFRSSQQGFVTGIRFFKGTGNTGTHVGSLWTSTGTRLASATFGAETATGWQEVTFSSPVPISADTTYVASYYAPAGRYALDNSFFTTATVRSPLTALASGSDGPNGVYRYGSGGGFPTSSFQSSNYWVDVVFTTTNTDTIAPTVQSTSPAAGQSGVTISAAVIATFSESVQPSSIQAGVSAPGGTQVPVTTTYDPVESKLTLTPAAPLAYSTTYTVQISGATDAAGNVMAPVTWTFTTGAEPPPPPTQGPGGPIAVVTSAGNPFTSYLAEIMRAEGLNEFRTVDVSGISSTTLDAYDVVVLGEVVLTQAQVDTLTTWVQAGGNLIAMRPDAKLASLLGLTVASGTLTDTYLKVDGTTGPGAGITDQVIQFHGTANRYALNGASAVAALYSSATAATANPAVTVRSVGSNGGQAAAFAYDLSKSVVLTRQGNPAWAGLERDGKAPTRSDDMFYGSASVPGWLDMDKVGIPQADEQQRLLANLILTVSRDTMPLPRFWYFPGDARAAIVATGDDHARNGTQERMAIYDGNSPAGCNVADWECLRFTSYVDPGTPISNTVAKAFEDKGFEIGVHPENGCTDFNPQSLQNAYASDLSQWHVAFPSLRSPVSSRFHCLVWSDWGSQFETERSHGIRLDTNYYYWPGDWVQDRPGFMTGSGLPMRFAKVDGTIVDVFQATTQMTDESGQSYPFTPNTLLDRALGSLGYYGFFTANMHTDNGETAQDEALVASARARGVPIISAAQLLTWTDGRNTSSFGSLNWTGSALTFTVSVGTGADNLRAMVPTAGPGGRVLSAITRGGNGVSFTLQTIKGMEYAVFNAAAGSYTASYSAGSGAPAIAAAESSMASDGTATLAWTTDEPATSEVLLGTAPTALTSMTTEAGTTGDHDVVLDDLQPGSTYYYRVASTDPNGNRSVWPESSEPAAKLVVPATDIHRSAGAEGRGFAIARRHGRRPLAHGRAVRFDSEARRSRAAGPDGLLR